MYTHTLNLFMQLCVRCDWAFGSMEDAISLFVGFTTGQSCSHRNYAGAAPSWAVTRSPGTKDSLLAGKFPINGGFQRKITSKCPFSSQPCSITGTSLGSLGSCGESKAMIQTPKPTHSQDFTSIHEPTFPSDEHP